MRLIDADILFEKVGKINPHSKEEYELIGEIMNMITYSYTEYKPQKTGKWIIKTDGIIFKKRWGKCSECGNTLDFGGVNAGRGDSNFCPNCGTRMITYVKSKSTDTKKSK